MFKQRHILQRPIQLDYRIKRTARPHPHRWGCCGAGRDFKFLGVYITKDLTWSTHTRTVTKRAQQHLFHLRRMKRFGMGPRIFKRFYSCTAESILIGCITAWYGKCTPLDCKALQRVVRTAQYITGAELPAIQDLYIRWCQRKAQNNYQRPQPRVRQTL